MCDILKSVREEIADIESVCIKTHIGSSEEVYNAAQPSLESMPLEIILKICSYLDAEFLKTVLGKVCSRFDDILSDVSLWKHRVSCKVSGSFPPLSSIDTSIEDNVDWTEMCIEMEVEKNKWCNVDTEMSHFVIKDVHYASVDAVILVNEGKTCISGGRDRCLALWNVMDFKSDESCEDNNILNDFKPTKVKHDAHSGWIWDLATSDVPDSYIYSASWDNTVKAWDIKSEFECVQTFQCKMSALSVIAYGYNVMAGLYSKKILTFDVRNGNLPVNMYMPHRGPVLALTTYGNLVASVSEDKTLAIFDRVAGKIMENDIKIPSDKAYPVCLSWNTYAMYVSDSKGTLHLFSPNDHKYVRSHELWPESDSETERSNKIVGCYQGQGTVICCSDRGQIKFLYNCSPPKEYHSIQTNTADVTKLRYLNGILAVGTCDAALEFWIPKEEFNKPNL
ncbi:F-box/WD repeat-containing protein 9 [Bicyclus anynana]|uniref:F-box/WD repeat-containing protein 9 n=1 Tax=Bicyclus anynana TaxID=110368 RepID=A0A6J1MS92_BICAN|nr:F-box/WD repeat-containing protein 9 [Bicyclus anynana]XP_023935778.2 F-box/WD repeat-containing protein 9 [Bicyclus anynana]